MLKKQLTFSRTHCFENCISWECIARTHARTHTNTLVRNVQLYNINVSSKIHRTTAAKSILEEKDKKKVRNGKEKKVEVVWERKTTKTKPAAIWLGNTFNHYFDTAKHQVCYIPRIHTMNRQTEKIYWNLKVALLSTLAFACTGEKPLIRNLKMQIEHHTHTVLNLHFATCSSSTERFLLFCVCVHRTRSESVVFCWNRRVSIYELRVASHFTVKWRVYMRLSD